MTRERVGISGLLLAIIAGAAVLDHPWIAGATAAVFVAVCGLAAGRRKQ